MGISLKFIREYDAVPDQSVNRLDVYTMPIGLNELEAMLQKPLTDGVWQDAEYTHDLLAWAVSELKKVN